MLVLILKAFSSIITGMFEAVPYQRETYTDYYVDGGVLCNYPIHCFDGEFHYSQYTFRQFPHTSVGTVGVRQNFGVEIIGQRLIRGEILMSTRWRTIRWIASF